MQVKMVVESLIPGVQHGDDPHRSTKACSAKLKQRFTDGFKQQAEQNFFVGQDHTVEEVGQGKHQMKIAHRQKLGTLLLKPLGLGQGLALGTVAVAAGVVARVLKAARVALLEMPSQFSRATDLNGPHDLSVRGG